MVNPETAGANCAIVTDLPPAATPPSGPLRPSEWLIGVLVLTEAAALTWARFRSRRTQV